MSAPHFHSTDEAKKAIKSIEHNASGPGSPSGKNSGPPSGVAGGSARNQATKTPGVTSSEKGSDWITKRGL